MNFSGNVIERSPFVRCRTEGDDNFLLYHSKTDELHLISDLGKAIFDMCEGQSVNKIVDNGAELVRQKIGADVEQAQSEVLSYLCELKKRSLIVLR